MPLLTHSQANQRHGHQLLVDTLAQLSRAGYVKFRVDTCHHPDTNTTIRHHYSGGIYSLTATTQPGNQTTTVTWDIRRALPTVDTIVDQLHNTPQE